MRLHYRLFLVMAAVLLLLVVGAVWGLRMLTGDLGRALDDAGLSVGRAVVAVLTQTQTSGADMAPDVAAERVERRVIVRSSKNVLDPISEAGIDAIASLAGSRSTPRGELRLDLNTLRGDGGELRLTSDGAQHLIRIPRSGTEQALDAFSRRVLIGALGALLIGLLLVYVLARRLARPLAELAATAVRVGQGELGSTVAVHGGPELRATQQTFNQMSLRLKALDEERTRLLELKGLGELGEVGRGIAHSLRNPLNTLGLALDALGVEAELDRAARADLHQRGRDQIRRMDDALRTLLVLGTGAAHDSTPVDLRELLDDLLLEASQRAAGRLHLQLQMPPQALPLRMQRHELRAALQAVLVNALEASPDGAVVEICLRPDTDQRMLVEIADRGPGVAAQIRPRLYTPHATSKPDGAGMGLFLAQRILRDRYGGRLVLEDREGGGTLARMWMGARQDD